VSEGCWVGWERNQPGLLSSRCSSGSRPEPRGRRPPRVPAPVATARPALREAGAAPAKRRRDSPTTTSFFQKMLVFKQKNCSQRQAEGMKNSPVGKAPAAGSRIGTNAVWCRGSGRAGVFSTCFPLQLEDALAGVQQPSEQTALDAEKWKL